MKKSSLSSASIRYTVALVLVLGLVLGWTTVAFAQTSAGGQYGNPTATASGNPGSSGNAASGGSGGSGGGAAGGGSGGGAAGGSSGGAAGGSSGGSGPGGISALPATGGLSPFLIGAGALALGSAGLLVLRRR